MGYPNFYYDKRNTSPILRSGVIATSPLEDFYFNDDVIVQNYKIYNVVLPDKLSGFLIDASVYGGSSGSLVINRTNVLPITIGGKRIPTIPFPFVLGILTYSYFNFEGSGRIGLGGVISSRVIKKTIEDYIHSFESPK